MLALNNPSAQIYVPAGGDAVDALGRTTHLGIGAHQDDLEILAYHGILVCFDDPSLLFSGVVVTDGAGSARTGPYAKFTDEQMREIRQEEQKKAAEIGHYGAVAMLDHPSSAVKTAPAASVVEDLKKLLLAAKPRVIYSHNPMDKHDTHVACALRTIQALREIRSEYTPEMVYGVEVWRDLDWLNPEHKIVLDVSGREMLEAALVGVFDSQIAGGKRYDLAIQGRRRANATFLESHGVDEMTSASYAVDLTPVVIDPSVDVLQFARGFALSLAEDISNRIRKFT